ncbi:MAG: phosphotransferase family protein [Thermoleophilia bacterium]|nr:phosphotransferase family protein [Thermoleophilia bacterium]
MNADQVHVQRLRSLDFWPGPIAIEPIGGGITNHNFRVESGGRRFAARLCVERPLLGIDRRNEVICQRMAHEIGVAPAIVHHEDGVLVSAYIDARTLDPAGVREPGVLPRIAGVLRTLHEGWDRITGEMLYFSAFQTNRTYTRSARELGAALPDDIDDLLEDARGLAHRMGPFRPTLCHNDLLPANILDDRDGRIWLVDWEYAGIGHPLFDLAGVSANCALSDDQDAAFLEAYRGRLDPVDVRDLRTLKAMSLLREALWSVIQTVASDLPFDYHKYATDNFALYRAARARLDAPSA